MEKCGKEVCVFSDINLGVSNLPCSEFQMKEREKQYTGLARWIEAFIEPRYNGIGKLRIQQSWLWSDTLFKSVVPKLAVPFIK